LVTGLRQFVPYEDLTCRCLKHLESYTICCCICVVMLELYYDIRVLKTPTSLNYHWRTAP